MKKDELLNGYTNYTSPARVQQSAVEESQLGNVGTSISLSVTYSASVSWTFSWSF
ncbi:signal protein [Bombilactobacillus thymidiniphilus]|uniref:Signal protein n=1 Tax=Bombilactobacillus thymidiniphilus TaxID=2923363 RepID=A0ABY4PEM1_9LACO|nr:signal protein [Bombilactobacillus thymidiniphilus]UQS84134.1 signal protein [Bombilactobacillus thymidiniphilus]